MLSLQTFPSDEILKQRAEVAEDYMRPNQIPFAVAGEGFLTPNQCARIVNRMNGVEPYNYRGCGGVTRQCPHPLEDLFKPMVEFAKDMNDAFWQYDLDDNPVGWFQTYEEESKYQIHMDSTPGQMRKLTAVTLLSDPAKYDGGELLIHFHPKFFTVPKTQGTVVVFQPWLLHEVLEVTRGLRQTINLAFWGPNFI